ncbi:uncharacterized protein TM35_000351770 [Trypanosoma theileri]|uniref:Uncharacterized protein n=1 Tax=Trypanosoma theileri TaxID=67003 RepID=A0A1X0NLT8_9TRYP|nr:uncharacterized protein TM35_000351770 [Trypanosoma theileri]ORC85433.1 hypothetical protein TM35_000351770 [Trypanosoma theileri]
MGSFEEFLLAAVEKAPFLIGETTASSSLQEKRKRSRDVEEVKSTTTTTTTTTSSSSSTEKKKQDHDEDIVRLQRILVDGPLQPLGAEHGLYHILLPTFLATMGAARDVWRAKQALQTAKEKRSETNETVGTSQTVSAPSAVSSANENEEQPLDEAALQRAVVAAQKALSVQQHALDAAKTKVCVLLEAVSQHSGSTT